VKVARGVLRGGSGGNAASLPDRDASVSPICMAQYTTDVVAYSDNWKGKMKKYFRFILVIVFGVILSSCSTSESAIQTAIAQTEAAKPTEPPKPTETETPEPTNTPTSTQTPSPTSTLTPTDTPEPLSIEERILGKWSGAMTNKNGDKVPALWTFIDGGVMVIEIDLLGYSYGAEWYVEGNRIHIIPETDSDNSTYRDAGFVTDDVMILTKGEADIKETWTRVEDE